MSTDLVSTFEASLAGLGLEWSDTPAEDLASAVDAAARPPAVAAPLPWEDLSLDGAAVTVDPTPAELADATTGVTAVGLGIAAQGTVLVQARPGGDEPVSLYPERHVAVLRRSDIVADVPAAIERLGDAFSAGLDSAVFATGVSASADMGALVEGVHGPLEVHVIVVEDR